MARSSRYAAFWSGGERGEDISLLSLMMLGRIAANTRETSKVPCLVQGISEGARRKLQAHCWPGNVRELQNVIARAIVLCEDTDIEPEAILLTGWRDQVDGLGSPSEALFGPRSEPAIAAPASSHPPSACPPGRVGDGTPAESFRDFRERLLEIHGRDYFESLLRHTGGNVSRAAKLAGVSRTYFRALVRTYGGPRGC